MVLVKVQTAARGSPVIQNAQSSKNNCNCNITFTESYFSDHSKTTATTVCHSSKISSSWSLRFFVSLVIVSGTAPCAACCCFIKEDEMTLCDLLRASHSDVLLVQAASRAATLLEKKTDKKIRYV